MFDTIIVLAGGESSRFWPLSDKNLFSFLGTPLIVSQIAKLTQYSGNIVVVVNSSNKENILSALEHAGIKVQHAVQQEKGQAAAIYSAKQLVHGKTLIVNANDIFEDELIPDLFEKLTPGIDGIITTKQVSTYFPGGYVVEKSGFVTEIVEKPGEGNTPSDTVKLVVDEFYDIVSFYETLESTTSTADDLYEKALSAYIGKGKKIAAHHYGKSWHTLKYPWHVLDVSTMYLGSITQSQGKNVSVAKSAVITGPVVLDDNVIIHEFVTIIGPAYIGKNTIVGTYSMIRESAIGADCLIGSYSEVTRSYLADNVFLHRNYVGDSVFDRNVLMGGDALIANYRFDQKEIATPIKGVLLNSNRKKLGAFVGSDVKIGVNSSIMPGVKIAPQSLISPQSLIQKDVTS